MTKLDDYEVAYAEVIEILNYIPMNEYKKIPKKYIIFMEENCSEDSNFVYNIALPFDKQKISDTAKDILGMIFRLFIVEDTKKEELNNKDRARRKQEELEKYLKYNPDNLFKNNKNIIKTNDEDIIKNVALTEYKDSFIKRIWNKILNLFKK